MRNFKGIGPAAREEQIVPACSHRQQPERHRGRRLHGLATLPPESSGSHDAAATDWHEPGLAGRSG